MSILRVIVATGMVKGDAYRRGASVVRVSTSTEAEDAQSSPSRYNCILDKHWNANKGPSGVSPC
jgi:hypothetical protein